VPEDLNRFPAPPQLLTGFELTAIRILKEAFPGVKVVSFVSFLTLPSLFAENWQELRLPRQYGGDDQIRNT